MCSHIPGHPRVKRMQARHWVILIRASWPEPLTSLSSVEVQGEERHCGEQCAGRNHAGGPRHAPPLPAGSNTEARNRDEHCGGNSQGLRESPHEELECARRGLERMRTQTIRPTNSFPTRSLPSQAPRFRTSISGGGGRVFSLSKFVARFSASLMPSKNIRCALDTSIVFSFLNEFMTPLVHSR